MKRMGLAVCTVFAAVRMIWGITADDITLKTGICGGL